MGCGRTARGWWRAGRALGVLGNVLGGGAPMVKRGWGGVGCGRTVRGWWGAGRALGVLGGVFGGGAPMVNPWVLWVTVAGSAAGSVVGWWAVVAVVAEEHTLRLPATERNKHATERNKHGAHLVRATLTRVDYTRVCVV